MMICVLPATTQENTYHSVYKMRQLSSQSIVRADRMDRLWKILNIEESILTKNIRHILLMSVH